MGQEEKTISGGSGSAHGEPLIVDYKAALAALKDGQEAEIVAMGGLVSAKEVADIVGLSVSHMRTKLGDLRMSGKVRGVQRTVNGVRGWMYSAKDIYELFKGSDA